MKEDQHSKINDSRIINFNGSVYSGMIEDPKSGKSYGVGVI